MARTGRALALLLVAFCLAGPAFAQSTVPGADPSNLSGDAIAQGPAEAVSGRRLLDAFADCLADAFAVGGDAAAKIRMSIKVQR
ncbi:hypothetical protein WJX73_002119 [Symbiochloris irregularis]|uniref:Uncharacterized protein n=1 Tax=Symbiochloris irregularis TaxID=706552 RepID=A0AAW1NQ42_9CHLO